MNEVKCEHESVSVIIWTGVIHQNSLGYVSDKL